MSLHDGAVFSPLALGSPRCWCNNKVDKTSISVAHCKQSLRCGRRSGVGVVLYHTQAPRHVSTPDRASPYKHTVGKRHAQGELTVLFFSRYAATYSTGSAGLETTATL